MKYSLIVQIIGSQESFVIWILLIVLHGFYSLQRTGLRESYLFVIWTTVAALDVFDSLKITRYF